MAVLSDYEEPTVTVPSTKQFNGVLDSSNPLGFIESAFEFAACESKLFQSDSVVDDVSSIVRGLKDKVDAEEKAAREKKKVNGNGAVKDATMKESKEEEKKSNKIGIYRNFLHSFWGRYDVASIVNCARSICLNSNNLYFVLRLIKMLIHCWIICYE